jgi:hypothetical protein
LYATGLFEIGSSKKLVIISKQQRIFNFSIISILLFLGGPKEYIDKTSRWSGYLEKR